MTFPDFNGQVQAVANQGREGVQRQERSSQETVVQAWGRVLVPPQGIHKTIYLSCFADTETPTRWEKLKFAAHKHVGPRMVRTRRLTMMTPTYLTTNQSEECPRADHTLLFEPLL